MKITKEIKVAVLVILSIVLFYWGFAFLKGKNLFDSSTKLYAVYDNVAGLVEAAPVTINGLIIGKVNTIEMLPDGFFKYHVDFSQLRITDETGALCVSRPTNPTGNVISDDELAKLDALAHEHKVPFIVDGAYGTPFPNILFVDAQPHWNRNTILVLSLSKLGLPGARTGIVIADPAIIQAFAKANTILSLATGNYGPAVARHLLQDGNILRLSRDLVAPFYRERMEMAVATFKSSLGDLPCFIHKPEGAIFLWLWFKDLPITSEALYQRLKARGVLVVSGHHFFPGLTDDWQHRHECIRVTYCQDPETVARGAAIIADEVREVYRTAV